MGSVVGDADDALTPIALESDDGSGPQVVAERNESPC